MEIDKSIKLFGEKVLIRKEKKETELIIPEIANKFQKGKIVAIGNLPEKYDMKIGDVVLFQFPGLQSSIKIGTEFLEVLEIKNILGKITGDINV